MSRRLGCFCTRRDARVRGLRRRKPFRGSVRPVRVRCGRGRSPRSGGAGGPRGWSASHCGGWRRGRACSACRNGGRGNRGGGFERQVVGRKCSTGWVINWIGGVKSRAGLLCSLGERRWSLRVWRVSPAGGLRMSGNGHVTLLGGRRGGGSSLCRR